MKRIKNLSERNYTFLAVVWTLVITFLSLTALPKTSLSSVPVPAKDKIVHVVFYFMFVFLWLQSSLQIKHKTPKIIILAVVYGILIEVLQEIITHSRQASFLDVLANISGALLAMFFLNKKK